jgi:fructan beta-fructosidase
MRHVILSIAVIVSLFLLTSSKPEKIYYSEIYRPQFHFTPEKNFMGNPCGLIYSEGIYHLFYQYNPDGLSGENFHWGHASGTDLVHWKHLPVAISSDNLQENREFCTALPGSAIIDKDNVLGLEKGDHKTMVIFYTGKNCGQRIAWSIDNGLTWNNYSGNPVIPFVENDMACHPRVFWHEPSGKWIMVLFRKPGSDERLRGFSFYSSSNLVKWEFQSHLAGFSDDPDLVELRVNNRPDDTRWVVIEGDGSYVIGSFDGKTFTPESIRMKSDFGKNYYGAQTWSNIPANDGRTIQLALMIDGKWPEMPFNGQMTFPSELSLRKINSGIFLIRQPAKEIEKLQNKIHSWKNENLIPGINQNILKKIQGDCFRITGRFDLKTCESFGIMFRAGKKNPGTEMVYNVKRQTLTVLGQTVPLEPVDNKIMLDILIDRASLEIYANDGRAVISNLFINKVTDRSYILFCTGGELMVEELNAFEMKSAWNEVK